MCVFLGPATSILTFFCNFLRNLRAYGLFLSYLYSMKLNSNHQKNLENTIQVEFYKEGRNQKIIFIFFSLNLPFVFIFKWHFDKFQNQSTGHHLGEVLQGRSKSKFNTCYLIRYQLCFQFNRDILKDTKRQFLFFFR